LVRVVSDEKLLARESIFVFDFVFQLRNAMGIELMFALVRSSEEKSIGKVISRLKICVETEKT
jgi:hypothetical protein